MDNEKVSKERPIGSMSISLGQLHTHFLQTGGAAMAVDGAIVNNGLESGTIAGSVRMVLRGRHHYVDPHHAEARE
jgi:hypothetical protein